MKCNTHSFFATKLSDTIWENCVVMPFNISRDVSRTRNVGQVASPN